VPLEDEEAAQSRSLRSDSGREVWRKIVGVACERVNVVRRWISF
jgi:hypothetical protein